MNVLIISLSLGAGHDRSAAETQGRLNASGCGAQIVDLLSLYPFALGQVVRATYSLQLKYWPQSYERAFQNYDRIKRRFAYVNSVLVQRRLQRLLTDSNFDVILANNPHAICGVGRLSRLGKINQPVVAQIMDAGVHPLWINDGGAHMVVHKVSVDDATAMGAGRTAVVGPMVSVVRNTSLQPDGKRVLVSAGSWAVGDLEATIRGVIAAGFTPVVRCGRNDALLKRLLTRSDLEAHGWTNEAAAVLQSCVAVVDNAGGLSSWEAIALGVPVLGYQPIPGHGRLNLTKMYEAGLLTFCGSETELAYALNHLPAPSQLPSQPDLRAILESALL